MFVLCFFKAQNRAPVGYMSDYTSPTETKTTLYIVGLVDATAEMYMDFGSLCISGSLGLDYTITYRNMYVVFLIKANK